MLCNNPRKKARRIKHVWAMLLLLLLSTACSCTEATLPAEPVTIMLAYPDSEAERYETLIAEFNEIYPHITIKHGAEDNEADVFLVSPFGLGELLEEERILSIDPLVQEDESFDLADFYPGTVETFTSGDKLWAVPFGVTVMVLYYNQDLFDRYGVPYPEPGWTWDDFLDTARALRDPEDGVFGYGDIDQYFDPFVFIYLHGGSITDSVQNPTRMTYGDPRTIEAMEWYAALIHDYNVAPTRGQLHSMGGNVRAGVYLNQVGMWIDWIDQRGGSSDPNDDWPGEWKMRWGMVPVPHGEQAVIPMTTSGYAISSDTAHPDECWRWISFLNGQQRIPFNMIPARKSLAESAEYRELVGDDFVDVATASLAHGMPLSPALFDFISFSIYGPAINSILSGTRTPQEALRWAQRQSEGVE